jgi:hypothetical protein
MSVWKPSEFADKRPWMASITQSQWRNLQRLWDGKKDWFSHTLRPSYGLLYIPRCDVYEQIHIWWAKIVWNWEHRSWYFYIWNGKNIIFWIMFLEDILGFWNPFRNLFQWRESLGSLRPQIPFRSGHVPLVLHLSPKKVPGGSSSQQPGEDVASPKKGLLPCTLWLWLT